MEKGENDKVIIQGKESRDHEKEDGWNKVGNIVSILTFKRFLQRRKMMKRII